MTFVDTTPVAFEDEPTAATTSDPRVTCAGPGQYAVIGRGTTQYVFATDDLGWIVTTDPGLTNVSIGCGAVVGFADGDQAITAALSFADARTS